MSPRYERRDDLVRERDVARKFCTVKGCKYKKIKEIDDFAPDVSFWKDGRRVAVGEIKVRTVPSDHYPTYLISKAKIDSIFERWYPLPVLLVVRWSDCIKWVKVTEEARVRWKIRKGGRVDRGDPKDVELCYYIPIDDFKELS